MQPSKISAKLNELCTKSSSLIICLVAHNRDAAELASALSNIDLDNLDFLAVSEAIKRYVATVSALQQSLEDFCVHAGSVFDEDVH